MLKLMVASPPAIPTACATEPTIIGMVIAPTVAVAIQVPVAMVEALNFLSMVDSVVGYVPLIASPNPNRLI
ncbi:hypothetical protein DSECCO2_637330 [anaerobic digester metagenome]